MSGKYIAGFVILMQIILGLTGSPAHSRGKAAELPEQQGKPDQAYSEIRVLFKLDPKIMEAVYLGEVWISPSRFTSSGRGGTLVVEMKAEGLDRDGQWQKIRPVWETGNPASVRVTPPEGHMVTLTVRREGEEVLKATYGNIEKKLAIRAWRQKDALFAEISQ